MKHFDISPKKLSIMQSLVCLVLSILLAVCSLLPIVSFDADGEKASDEMNELFDRVRVGEKYPERLDTNFKFDIPDKIDLTLETAIRADVLLVKTIAFRGDLLKIVGDEREITPEQKKEARELTDKWLGELEDPKDQAAFYVLASLFGQMFDVTSIIGLGESDVFGFDTDNIFSLIFDLLYDLLLLVMIVGVLFYSHFLPILSVTCALFCIKNAIQYRTCLYQISGRTYGKLQKRLLDTIGIAIIVAPLDGASMGIGTILVILIGIVNIFAAAALTRGIGFAGELKKYVDITQICSLCASVGGLLCYFMLADLGFFREFYAALDEFLVEFFIRTEIIGDLIDGYIPNLMFFIDVALALVFVFAGALRIVDISTRVCSITALKCRAESAPKTLIVGGATILVASFAPFVLTFLKNGILHDVDVGTKEVIRDSAETIYHMSSDVRIKLIFILIGAAIILASGIVMKILRNKHCPNITDLDAARVFDDTEISKDRLH